jgi:hypothetical protein
MKNKIDLDGVWYDLENCRDLIELITRFTDGVYNANDTASFTKSDVDVLEKIREYYFINK